MTRSGAWLLVAVVLTASLVGGERHYIMRDGTVLDAATVHPRGSVLVEPLTGPDDEGVAERLHAVADVVRLEWPAPEALAAARERLDQGAPEEALALVAPVMDEFSAFPGIAGSWWDEAALIKAQALLAAGRSTEASPIVQSLLAAQPAPEVEQLSRLLFVEIDLAGGRTDLAAAMLEQIGDDAPLSDALAARLWWLRGEVLLRQGDYERALEAYLHVPAFFGREWALRPAVLLGSARAYQKFGDEERADRALNELLADHPRHPLALQVRAEAEANRAPRSRTVP